MPSNGQIFDRDFIEADLHAMTPPGYLYTIVIVSYFKRALVTIEMPVAERLHFLETINKCVDAYFTEAALAAIEPACDTAAEMIRECFKVDEGNRRSGKSLDLLASREVFSHLVAVNPSLLTAIKLCRGNVARASEVA
jgi:hypothetical protein